MKIQQKVNELKEESQEKLEMRLKQWITKTYQDPQSIVQVKSRGATLKKRLKTNLYPKNWEEAGEGGGQIPKPKAT